MLMLALNASVASAQDAAAVAAQQANQQAIQASQQAQQQAAQSAQNDAQRAAADNSVPYYGYAVKPRFSIKPGRYAQPTTVKITDSTRGAIIYYTTDGWTPTVGSTRYTGPITISSTTTLQAIAVVPYRGRSLITSGEYIITGTPNSQMAPQPPVASTDATVPADSSQVLLGGTPVELIFAGDVSSKNASVGDKVPVTLASDLMIGSTTVAKKGSLGSVTIIQVDKTGAGGAPGDLAFRVDPLNVNGRVIQLRGMEEREGEAKPPNATALIPVVGPFTVFKHGKDATISSGTAFTAYVDGDISLASLQ
jgi:hypothetical protein